MCGFETIYCNLEVSYVLVMLEYFSFKRIM